MGAGDSGLRQVSRFARAAAGERRRVQEVHCLKLVGTKLRGVVNGDREAASMARARIG